MPFGLCNAPATFAQLMKQVLEDIVWDKCLVYLDDIVAFGKCFSAVYINLIAVFERLRSANLKLKPKKCELFQTELEDLGHTVSREGIKPTVDKVAALLSGQNQSQWGMYRCSSDSHRITVDLSKTTVR